MTEAKSGEQHEQEMEFMENFLNKAYGVFFWLVSVCRI